MPSLDTLVTFFRSPSVLTAKCWPVAARTALSNCGIWVRARKFACLEGHNSWVRSLAFSPDGKILASGSSDRTVKLWDLAAGRNYHTLTGHSGYVFSLAFSPDGQILASSSSDTTVKLWLLAARREIFTLTGHSSAVGCVAFSPDGQALVSGSGDGTIKLWRRNSPAVTPSGAGPSGSAIPTVRV